MQISNSLLGFTNWVRDLLLDSDLGRAIFNFFFRLSKQYNHKNYPITPSAKPERGFWVVSKNPVIVITSEAMPNVELFSDILGQQKAYIIVKVYSSLLYDPYKIRQCRDAYNKQKQKFPNHHIILLCNTLDELKAVKSFCPASHYVNNNCFVDESHYKLTPTNTNKRFDLIYNGRLNKSKRHYLLPRIKDIGLISGDILNFRKEARTLSKLKKEIPDAKLLNFNPPKKLSELCTSDFAEIPNLNSSEINAFINQSKIGMILSATEGANYASMEYLMCGIPVVSTISLGGRDVFLQNQFCKIVPSNKRAVKKAVSYFLENPPDPNLVRSATLAAIQPHRDRFIGIIQEILNNEEVTVSSNEFWDQFFQNKMCTFKKFPEVFHIELQNAPSLS